MKWLNCYRMRLMMFVFVAAIVLVGGIAHADIIMSEPSNVGPVINDAYDMQEGDLSHDDLEFYFSANPPGGYGSKDIWVAKRETLNSPWQEPDNIGPNVNSHGHEAEPSISGDGLELYFGCWDDWVLRVCTRPSKDAPWSSPVKIGPPVCSVEPALEVGSNDAWAPDISADGLSLYFSSTRVGGYGNTDIWMATRATTDDPWGEPVNLGPNVNTSSMDWSPCISTDGLTLVFSRVSPWGMWVTTRKSVNDDWGPAVQLPLKSGAKHGAILSPDNSTLYLEAYSSWGGYGAGDYWQVNFIPIVDFNGDEIVDIADLVILIEHWGQEELLCDIAPLPLGDDVVDTKDLEMLMSYWGQEVNDPKFIAHYKLDETEGNIAEDSAGEYDGTLYGEPLWKPEGGMVDGAIELDGIDDYISTPFVLNPAGPEISLRFSVFAWIKGGQPGQVIISQEDGDNWLMADPTDGTLRTDLRTPEISNPRGTTPAGPPLISSTVVTDGDWHRVGFVWDGSYRTLYVDDVEVAKDKDVQSGLERAYGGLYIGAGKALEAGSFFSGLIDDVRIYNRAIIP